MSRRATKTIERKLRDRLEELESKVGAIESARRMPLDRDSEEQAQELEVDQTLEQLEQVELQETEAIKAALKRIETGTYGVCVACGEDIEPGRLTALPYAVKCGSCAGAGRPA